MKAVIALSADPITNGHIDVIQRARAIFPKLIVAIGINSDKKYTFNLATRERLAKEALKNLDVTVTSFSGLLVDFVKLNCAKTIVRSIRNSIDYNYEKILYDVNTSQKYGIDTVLFFSQQNLAHVSSTVVKELQKNYGNVVDFVPLVVKESLEQEISNQYLIGVTGEIGAGKSHVTKQLQKIANFDSVFSAILCHPGVPMVHNIDMDDLGRKILTEYTEPYYLETRAKLVAAINHAKNYIVNDSYNICIECSTYKIDLKKLTAMMFLDSKILAIFNEIMLEPTLMAFRQSLKSKQGLIFVNSALFAEADMTRLTNNNIILVRASQQIRIDRLKKRGYSNDEVNLRMKAQMNYENKLEKINERIRKDQYGTVLPFNNDSATETEIQDLYLKILNIFGIKK